MRWRRARRPPVPTLSSPARPFIVEDSVPLSRRTAVISFDVACHIVSQAIRAWCVRRLRWRRARRPPVHTLSSPARPFIVEDSVPRHTAVISFYVVCHVVSPAFSAWGITLMRWRRARRPPVPTLSSPARPFIVEDSVPLSRRTAVISFYVACHIVS